MSGGDQVFEGGCFCGANTFEARGPVKWSVVCHCSICARTAGASGVDLVAFEPAQFKFTKGDSVTYFFTSPGMKRSFCSICGSNLVSQAVGDSMPAFVDLPLVLFKREGAPDGPIAHFDALKAQAHIFYKQRLHNHADGLPKFETYPFGAPLNVDKDGNVID